MTFLWPEMLWLLLIVPMLIAGYLMLLRRKKKLALRYASLAVVREAMGPGQRLRRHIPPLLFLLAMILMMIAIARPASVITLPSQYETVILAMDVSGSMRANDVAPSRIGAAQAAVRKFVADQPSNTRIGVAAFAGTASVVQAPTQHRDEILAAIDQFQLQRGTAVGSGILISLKMIFPEIEFDLRSSNPRPDSSRDNTRGAPLGEPPKEASEFKFIRGHHPADRWPDHHRA
jgi:Ca-activated chloride channel family protein